MVNNNYQWHQRWAVDLANSTATHESGLIVRFKRDPAVPAAWDGTPVNSKEWFELMKDTMPPQELMRHTSRLIREAGDSFFFQLKKRDR